jgi:hypothetical protein
MPKEVLELIEQVRNGEIKPYHVIGGGGLPCLICLTENPVHKNQTENPVIINYKEDGHWETVYFHKECIDRLLNKK